MEQNRTLIISTVAALLILTALGAVLISTSSLPSFSTNISASSGTVKTIPVSGAISSSSSGGFLASASLSSGDIAEAIREANRDSSVDAILLKINSPGGAPVASHEIVRAVDSVDKPIAAQIRETGASGAYWVASATDHITADPVSITGSVGVTASYLQYSGLLERYNITYQQVTAGEYKELASPFTNLTSDEAALLEEKITRIGDYFLEDVVANRDITPADREQIETGVWFTGLESRDVGLVDSLGGEDRAVQYLENQTNKSLSVADASFERSFFQQLSGVTISTGTALFDNILRSETKTRPQLR